MEREMARGRDFNLDRIGFVLSLNPNTVQLQLINEREKSLLHFTAVGKKEVPERFHFPRVKFIQQ